MLSSILGAIRAMKAQAGRPKSEQVIEESERIRIELTLTASRLGAFTHQLNRAVDELTQSTHNDGQA